jgi:hypothetical protein
MKLEVWTDFPLELRSNFKPIYFFQSGLQMSFQAQVALTNAPIRPTCSEEKIYSSDKLAGHRLWSAVEW